MSIHIYNSLSKKKEEFVPLKGKTVKMYSCGVTVYDQCHLGHARSLYIFDVITSYLRFRGYDVHFVRNITDIDDKIINRAKETKTPFDQVVRVNIDGYHRDLKALGVNLAENEPRATENIDDMIKHIEGLIAKKTAYAQGGDVYFDVRSFKSYGKLSGQSIEKMLDGVRIDPSEKKKDPLDFALWKSSKEDEPGWNSPWGRGRPGWHIECSCMSMKHLNTQTLDIHAGGRDLIFPHHENEIAQSEALTGKPFAKYWIHHGLLTINGQKMAKSLGNFITIQDALKKYTVDELKFFFLASHYASPVDFNEEKMAEARKALERIDILFWKASELLDHKELVPVISGFIAEAKSNFLDAMDDDFNTPKALAAIFDLVNQTNKFIEGSKEDKNYEGVVYCAVDTIANLLREILGLYLKETEKDLNGTQKDLLEARKQARADKDFKRSDELRDALKKEGIIVEDTKTGQVWRWA